MTTLTTGTGRKIPCEAVVKGLSFPFLYIHTSALSRLEADTIFGDPRETQELAAVETVTGEDGSTATIERSFRGWTEIYAVQRSPIFDAPGTLMIWLQKPEVK